MFTHDDFIDDCMSLRSNAPLVLCLTNEVASTFNANALLAVGAKPIMSRSIEEMDQIVASSDAVYINIGTADERQAAMMQHAVEAATAYSKPWVLDPVGVGFTTFRTNLCRRLLAIASPAAIRCNASEIKALHEGATTARGVDSTIDATDVHNVADEAARRYGTTIAVSGATDYITDGESHHEVPYGTPLMAMVTAMGCSATAIVAALCAVQPCAIRAAFHAMTLMGMAGERAARHASGPGTMMPHFIDSLYIVSKIKK